jgi:hypothetical protein
MGRFHMARCRSSAQLLAFLATLPQRVQQLQARARAPLACSPCQPFAVASGRVAPAPVAERSRALFAL